MVMDCVLELLWGSEQNTNDAMMWTLLQHGVIDACSEDSLWDGSTRSMRYLAVLVSHLWGLLVGERTRVSPHPLFLNPLVDLWGFQGNHLEKEQHQMKRDLAEVKVYTEAMAESNQARDMYINKEQDKFFQQLNRQRNDIDSLKEKLEQSELRVRALELANELMLERMDSMVTKLCFCTQQRQHLRCGKHCCDLFIYLTDLAF